MSGWAHNVLRFIARSHALNECHDAKGMREAVSRVQIPYLGLIQQLLWACPSTAMILLEVPHVSLRLQLRAMSVDDVAHAAAQILWRHSYQEACFVAHSYGTFCASRICQLHRSLVHSMVSAPIAYLHSGTVARQGSGTHTGTCFVCGIYVKLPTAQALPTVLCISAAVLHPCTLPSQRFLTQSSLAQVRLSRCLPGLQVLIDPVCFLTCYPQLLYNFVYKVPLLAETLSSVTGLLSAARFLFSRDMIIAEVGTLAP